MKPPRRRKQLITKTITVPGNFQRTCDDFNSGRFFEAHEHLEEVWQYESGEVRNAYKGLIQIAAAFVHLSRANHFGSERLLRTALGYLEPYRANGAMGFDLNTICSAAEDTYRRVLEAGKENITIVDIARRPFYAFDSSKLASEARTWSAWGFSEAGEPLEMEITVAE